VTFCGLLRHTLKSVLRYGSKVTRIVISIYEDKGTSDTLNAVDCTNCKVGCAFCEWETGGTQGFCDCNYSV